MGLSQQVPMVAPDGTTGWVPPEKVDEGMQQGGKLGVRVIAPDGTPGTIPMENAHEAMRQGGSIIGSSSPGRFTLPGLEGPRTVEEREAGAKANFEQAHLFIPGVGYTAMDVPKGTAQKYEAEYQKGLQKGEKLAAVTGAAGAIPIAGGIASTAAGGGLLGIGASSATQGALSAGVTAAGGGSKGEVIGAGLLGAAGPLLRGPAALKEAAGEGFADLGEQMGQHTVDASEPGQHAMKIADLPGKMPNVVEKFLDRTTNPSNPPLTYDEARNYITFARDEMAEVSKAMKPHLQKFIDALGDVTEEAADKAGKLQQYQQTMSKYATSKQVSTTVDKLSKLVRSQVTSGVPGAVVALSIRDALKPWLGGLLGD